MTVAMAQALIHLLRPLVRILLRNGIAYGIFAEIVRWVYVDTALRDFQIEGRKPSDSRAAVLTGLSRKEVRRLRISRPADDDNGSTDYNRAARVVSAWVREEDYVDRVGYPKPLPIDGPGVSFAALVRSHSGDMPHRAVLDELLRVGAVEVDDDGNVRLMTRAYIPSSGEAEKLGILGRDVGALVTTIDRNLQGEEAPLFQRTVAYDNLPEAALLHFRELSRVKSQELLEEFDRFLAQRDRDMNPQSLGEGRWQAGVGIFYFDVDLEVGNGSETGRAE